MKILVIHLQESILEDIKQRFAHWQVDAYSHGHAGIIAAKMSTFDLILCGPDMPVVSSIDFVRAVRILNLNRQTPVVLVIENEIIQEREKTFNALQVHIVTWEEIGMLNKFDENNELETPTDNDDENINNDFWQIPLGEEKK